MIKSSRWSRGPFKGQFYFRACVRVDRQYSAASHINIIGLLCLRHYGLTLAKPQVGGEDARKSVLHCFEHHPNYEALSSVRSGIEPD